MNGDLAARPVAVVELPDCGAVFGVRVLGAGWVETLGAAGVLAEADVPTLTAVYRYDVEGIAPTPTDFAAWQALLLHITRAVLADEESWLIFETLMDRGALTDDDIGVLSRTIFGLALA